MYMIRSRLLQLPDQRILAYSDVGEPAGPVVILAHGIPGCRLYGGLFSDWANYLGLRILTPDRPGWGGSTFVRQTHTDWAGDALFLLDHLGIKEFVALGGSGGGAYALALAARFPTRTKGVALVSAMGPSDTPETRRLAPFRLRFALSLVGAPYRLIHWMARALLRRMNRSRNAQDLPLEEELDLKGLRLEALRAGAPAYLRELRLGRKWDFSISDIRVPVRIWHGDRDRKAPVALMEPVLAKLPSATLTLVKGGHDATTASTEEFLRWLAHCLSEGGRTNHLVGDPSGETRADKTD